ncbi:MAG TPA: zf-HC2 domain-containing protein [Steroidobacteraceae bacterium]|nr:zf-HC2 domain-containing protein [Steroidobacteraceae bacterium]
MQCAEAMRLQAYFDGELDAPSAAAMEGHLEHCAECRESLADLQGLRAALRSEVAHPRAPAALRDRISGALDRETPAPDRETAAADGETVAPDRKSAPSSARPQAALSGPTPPRRARSRRERERRRSFLFGAFSGAGGAAAAAVIAFMLVMTPGAVPIVDQIMSAHIRSLMPAHLIDVVSTDQHTVKPWFSGHADVSPVVANFAQQGYVLVGGRADYLDRQRAAVVVYQHGAHVINVFSWAWDGKRMPGKLTRNGYHLLFWRSGNLEYCAVSDAGWDEMTALTGLLQGLSARDPDAQQG